MINIISKFINSFSAYAKYVSLFTQAFMMVFITIAVILRNLNHSIMGDYEIVQLLMIVVIMMGLPYVQQIKAHVSIGLIVDRLPKKIQKVLDVISYLLTFVVCELIGWVNIQVAIDYFVSYRTSLLLKVPLYPFLFIIGIGFIIWGFVAFMQVFGVFKTKDEDIQIES
ncbi:TRAP transporter small permease [Bacillus dakarensis]|uniref:TRAP transporter small permease n=1 Tax=Robertmurraya dakarensis TaxID=1926278 RepID=UPI0009FEE753|nr:TRAP transporter small permease [Bacillus dakarensis]